MSDEQASSSKRARRVPTSSSTGSVFDTDDGLFDTQDLKYDRRGAEIPAHEVEKLAQLDVKIESRKGFVQRAIQARKLLDKRREELALEKPELVAKVDKHYEVALQLQDIAERRKQL